VTLLEGAQFDVVERDFGEDRNENVSIVFANE
jgi:hypothetical protein